MYKSPIEKICGELQTQMVQEDEKMIMKAIKKVGINVDKEELIKALQYDRNQYKKGYEDGKNEVLDKIRAEIEELDGRYVIGDYGTYGENTPKYVRLWDVLQIIDKYKSESEDKK